MRTLESAIFATCAFDARQQQQQQYLFLSIYICINAEKRREKEKMFSEILYGNDLDYTKKKKNIHIKHLQHIQLKV
jgi:hypothetical protein